MKTNKNKLYKTNKYKTLKGGKFLDKGGFGCVIKPALPCTRLNQSLNLNNYVSKIITENISSIDSEIVISDMLKQIDPDNIFFITIKEYCYITELPNKRTDVIDVKYKNATKKKFNTSLKKNLDKKYCHMDLNSKNINLILEFGGISLSNIMKKNRKDYDNIKSKIHQLFVTNINAYFKHLLIGLEKMHRIKIVNRDIKQKNIMIYLEPNTISKLTNMNLKEKNKDSLNMMKVRYIDFGLSTHITSSLSNDIYNISLSGTYRYLSPELFISYILVKYKHKNTQYKIDKIYEKIAYVKDALKRIEEKDILSNLQDIINSLYKKIQYLYDNNLLLDKYFGIKNKYNGYLQKADVYALGITIFDTLQLKQHSNVDVRSNKLLYDLLLKMIAIDPDKRYNVIECINHPYFQT